MLERAFIGSCVKPSVGNICADIKTTITLGRHKPLFVTYPTFVYESHSLLTFKLH